MSKKIDWGDRSIPKDVRIRSIEKYCESMGKSEKQKERYIKTYIESSYDTDDSDVLFRMDLVRKMIETNPDTIKDPAKLIEYETYAKTGIMAESDAYKAFKDFAGTAEQVSELCEDIEWNEKKIEEYKKKLCVLESDLERVKNEYNECLKSVREAFGFLKQTCGVSVSAGSNKKSIPVLYTKDGEFFTCGTCYEFDGRVFIQMNKANGSANLVKECGRYITACKQTENDIRRYEDFDDIGFRRTHLHYRTAEDIY